MAGHRSPTLADGRPGSSARDVSVSDPDGLKRHFRESSGDKVKDTEIRTAEEKEDTQERAPASLSRSGLASFRP